MPITAPRSVDLDVGPSQDVQFLAISIASAEQRPDQDWAVRPGDDAPLDSRSRCARLNRWRV
jgi:hypothetical protein